MSPDRSPSFKKINQWAAATIGVVSFVGGAAYYDLFGLRHQSVSEDKTSPTAVSDISSSTVDTKIQDNLNLATVVVFDDKVRELTPTSLREHLESLFPGQQQTSEDEVPPREPKVNISQSDNEQPYSENGLVAADLDPRRPESFLNYNVPGCIQATLKDQSTQAGKPAGIIQRLLAFAGIGTAEAAELETKAETAQQFISCTQKIEQENHFFSRHELHPEKWTEQNVLGNESISIQDARVNLKKLLQDKGFQIHQSDIDIFLGANDKQFSTIVTFKNTPIDTFEAHIFNNEREENEAVQNGIVTKGARGTHFASEKIWLVIDGNRLVVVFQACDNFFIKTLPLVEAATPTPVPPKTVPPTSTPKAPEATSTPTPPRLPTPPTSGPTPTPSPSPIILPTVVLTPTPEFHSPTPAPPESPTAVPSTSTPKAPEATSTPTLIPTPDTPRPTSTVSTRPTELPTLTPIPDTPRPTSTVSTRPTELPTLTPIIVPRPTSTVSTRLTTVISMDEKD